RPPGHPDRTAAQAEARPGGRPRRVPGLARVRAAPEPADHDEAPRVPARRTAAARHLLAAVRPAALGADRPGHDQDARVGRDARGPAVPLGAAALQAGDALLHAGLDADVHVVHGRLPGARYDLQ